MAEESISQIPVGEFETVSELLASSESLQFAFILMIVGMIVIAIAYRKFSSLVTSHKVYYTRPHLARFIRRAILPFFAIALITSTNAYIQTSAVFEQEVEISGELSPEATFAKILNTFNILVIGYTISHLIPIGLTKRDKSILEKEDFDAWFDFRGFSDDDGDMFHKLYKWMPPKVTVEEIPEEEFQKHLKTKEGLQFLEEFRTTKGNPIGSYEKLVKDPFEKWKKSERVKYQKYYKNCITGNNQSGRKLKPGAKPVERSSARDSLTVVFQELMEKYAKVCSDRGINPDDPDNVSRFFDFGGEVLLGHLRYGTSGEFEEGSCHPFLRRSNWETRSLMLLGNFNMANAPELNNALVERGQHPVFGTDTQTILEEIGFFLDQAHQKIYQFAKKKRMSGSDIPGMISERLHMPRLLRKAAKSWDGGYTIAGAVGNGDCFVMRDPNGIRPAFYFDNDEFVGFASERVPLMTVFGLEQDAISEVQPGHVVFIKNTGELSVEEFADERAHTPCSFERIYFSRGNDPEIYRERKELGRLLAPEILKSIDFNLRDTVFSFIPNTAEIAYHGMMGGLREYRRQKVKEAIEHAMSNGGFNDGEIDDLVLHNWPRGEKIAHKDIKMRTFISQEKGRKQLVSHVYDISYGVVEPGQSLVVIDDSIVRGTTLRESILKILARTKPEKIVVVSSCPQIRYPDCYGIDMSELGKFIAFQAAIDLLKNTDRAARIGEVYDQCKEELGKPPGEAVNAVCNIYEPFTAQEISDQIARLIYPQETKWKGEVKVIYQNIENLHSALGAHCGDWYFTGNYPTPAGIAVVNRAFIQYCDGIEGRPYDLGL